MYDNLKFHYEFTFQQIPSYTKVSVLKVQFHNTVEFKVLLGTLKPLGFRRDTAPEHALNPAGMDSMASIQGGQRSLECWKVSRTAS